MAEYSESKKAIYNESKSDISVSQNNDDVIDLKDLWLGINRKKKWLFLTAGSIFFGSLIFSFYLRIFKPVFRGNFTILINDPMTPSVENNNGLLDEGSLFEQVALSTSSNYDIRTLITLLKSPIFLEPIAKEFKINLNDLANSIDIDQKGSEAGRIADGILNINLNINNLSKGKLILEKLSSSYLEASLTQRQKKLNDGLEFLNNQGPEILKKKNELQSRLVLFREKHNLIKPTNEGDLIKQKQSNIELKLLELSSERNRLKDVRKEIEAGRLSAIGFKQEMNDGLSISDFDQGLLQQLILVEKELAKAKSKFTKDSSIVKGLIQRRSQIQPNLLKNQLEAVDTALKLNSGKIETATLQKNELNKNFSKQPALIKEYKNIEQELSIANDNLMSLVSARENFQLEMAQNSLPWKIIKEPIMFTNPIEPNLRRNIFLGSIISLFFGVIVALIRDRIDHVFHFPNEVRNSLNQPLLGHIPHISIFANVREERSEILEIIDFENKNKEGKLDKKNNYQRFFYQEAFRNLYTSIRFLNSNEGVKTLLLTSSIPKEGKTLINILLAKTLAEIGIKTLLIDADLRKPSIHYRLGVNNILGLSNLLTDSKLTPKEVIQSIKINKDWDVITAGTRPPDPTRLLGSERLKEIINEIKSINKYDVILIDAPPVLGLSDSLLLGENIDGMILLVGLDIADRGLPSETIKKIKQSGINLFGILTNSTKEKTLTQSGSYGYGGYGKKYGYGYKYEYSLDYQYQPELYASYADNEDLEGETLIEKKQAQKEQTISPLLKLSEMITKYTKKLSKWLDN